MNRREFLGALASTVLAAPLYAQTEKPEGWDSLPATEYRELRKAWFWLHWECIVPETVATAAILAGKAERCVAVDVVNNWTESLRTLAACVGPLAPGEYVTPLRVYRNTRRPESLRLVAYVVRP